MVQQILTIVIPVSTLVEIMMPTSIQTNNINGTPLGTQSQLSWLVLINLLTITELIHGSNLAGLVHRRLVLHVNLGLELILGSKVKLANLIVNTHNRCNTNT